MRNERNESKKNIKKIKLKEKKCLIEVQRRKKKKKTDECNGRSYHLHLYLDYNVESVRIEKDSNAPDFNDPTDVIIS